MQGLYHRRKCYYATVAINFLRGAKVGEMSRNFEKMQH